MSARGARLPLAYNPRSGRRGKDPERLLAALPPELRQRVEPAPLEASYDYAPLIRQAQEAGGPLLVWGGDGTLHHAARALVAAGCPVPLGPLPGGSGNGLVRGLGLPLDPGRALAALLRGRVLRVDLPRLDGVPFLNVCGTGFEATLAHAFDRAPGRGFRTYARLSLGLWRKEGPLDLAWEAWQGEPGAAPEGAWSLCFANLPQYGSGLWIAPEADPLDGLLEVVSLSRPGVMHLASEVPQLFRRRGQTPLRKTARVGHATLRLPQACPWQLDGEPVEARDRAELSVERGAFPLQVGEGCGWGLASLLCSCLPASPRPVPAAGPDRTVTAIENLAQGRCQVAGKVHEP